MTFDEWVGVYKFGRLALIAIGLLGVAVYLYHPARRRRLEEPARRMLDEDDA
jgi:cbb3-type cytochrome oxidase subunit 3